MYENNKIETETSIFYIENGVLYTMYKEGTDVELEHLEENLEVRKDIQQGEKMLVLADVSEVWQFSDEARAFAARKEVSDLTIATAIVTGRSMPARLMANFYIKANKPLSPAKLFKSKDKALEWLSTFR